MGNQNSYTSLKDTSEGEDKKIQPGNFVEDTTEEKEPIRPSIFSWITMNWIGGIIRVGNKRPLENKDLSHIDCVFSSEETINMLEKAWNEEVKSSVSADRAPKLWRALLKMHSPCTYIWVVFLNFCKIFFPVVQPIFLSFILSHLTIYGVDERIYMVYIYILLIFLLVIFMAITETFYIKNTCRLSVHFRSSLVGLTIKKVGRITV